MGLDFHAANAVTHPAVLGCLQDGIELLRYAPTLQVTVASLVRVCHLLNPPDDDHDVSYSDPLLPFSIFVSVPLHRRPNDPLRVIESIVHEAMHLQLTLIEQTLPLVHASEAVRFSPWKGENRPIRGVLHALYVFRAIDRFLEELQARRPRSGAEDGYILCRREEIAGQIREIETFEDSPALTAWGSIVASQLMAA